MKATKVQYISNGVVLFTKEDASFVPHVGMEVHLEPKEQEILVPQKMYKNEVKEVIYKPQHDLIEVYLEYDV